MYVDDIIIISDDVHEIAHLKSYLHKYFLWYFLSVEVGRSWRGIVLSQKKYVLDMISETGILACRAANAP